MNLFDSVVVTDIINTVTVTSLQGRKEIMENRKHYGLSFCIDGQITYVHKGNNYVSKKGNAIVLPKGETYHIFGDKKGLFPVINFDTAEQFCFSPMVIPIEDEPQFLADYSALRTCLHNKSNRLRALSIFYGMIHKLSSKEKDFGILAPAIEYINKNYSSIDMSNPQLAELCNISEVYFRKLFIQKLDVTPKQYIIDLRLSKAKELLTDGTEKINAIAENCGFTNPYHFTRIFKEKTGITPSQYIKNNRTYGM